MARSAWRRVVGLTVGAALVAGTAALGAAPASAAEERGRSDAARAEHQRIVDFWTEERRAAAKPRVVSPSPKGKPAKGGGGGTTDVTGAFWSDETANVDAITGKVFFRMGGTGYVCSGAAVAATGANVVMTAGHCVLDDVTDAFATEWAFYPDYNGTDDGLKDPVGATAWTAQSLYTTQDWAQGDFADDVGYVRVQNSAGTGLTTLGTLPTVSFAPPTTSVTAMGYPAAGRKYDGTDLAYCQGTPAHRLDGTDSVSVACDMTGGSSGGPWFDTSTRDGTAPVVVSVNSYGYGGGSLRNRMFGPVLGAPEQDAFDAAQAGSCASDPLAKCSS